MARTGGGQPAAVRAGAWLLVFVVVLVIVAAHGQPVLPVHGGGCRCIGDVLITGLLIELIAGRVQADPNPALALTRTVARLDTGDGDDATRAVRAADVTSHVHIRRADVNTRDVPPGHLRRALEAGRYHARYPEAADLPMDEVYSGGQAAQIVAAVTQGAYLVGINPAFAAESFIHLLHTYDLWHPASPPWRRATVDVRSEVGGAVGLPLHQRAVGDLAAALDVDLGAYIRHQAVDDAATARDLLDAAFARHRLSPLGVPRPSHAVSVVTGMG